MSKHYSFRSKKEPCFVVGCDDELVLVTKKEVLFFVPQCCLCHSSIHAPSWFQHEHPDGTIIASHVQCITNQKKKKNYKIEIDRRNRERT